MSNELKAHFEILSACMETARKELEAIKAIIKAEEEDSKPHFVQTKIEF